MAQCTAPSRGHRTSSGAANCPACGRYGRRSYGHSFSSPSYSNIGSSANYNSSYGRSSSGRISTPKTRKPKWSKSGSSAYYSEAQVRTLTPFRETVEKRADIPDIRDIFLCHAWDDRKNIAKDIHDKLEALNVSVWFSEKDVPLGTNLLREIDRGLSNSKIGIVLVTPAFLKRLEGQGIADKELSALLARDVLIPIVHNTTYDELRDESPLLGSKSGLSTVEDTIDEIALKLSELVSVNQYM